MILAVIPARGGSKGIPRKNLQLLNGEPLVVHSVRHAQQAESVDVVVVSTDDDQIAEVAAQADADVVRRPPECAGDTASSESALLHALEVFRERGEGDPELLVFLQATSPIRRAADIDGAVSVLREGSYDSVFSGSPMHGFLWELGKGIARPLNYNPGSRPMRQQMAEQVVENGSIYILKPTVLYEKGARLGGRIGVYRMGFLEAIQIDEPDDLEVVRWVLEHREMDESGRKTGWME